MSIQNTRFQFTVALRVLGVAALTLATLDVGRAAVIETPQINTTIDNSSGELDLCANNLNSTINVNGLTKFFSNQTLAALNITSLGVVRDAVAPANWGRMIDTPVLNIATGGVLDLTNNAIVIRGGSLSLTTAQIASGFLSGPNGYWDGAGITSSCAANDPLQLTAVGVIDNAVFAYFSFSSVGLTGGEIIAAYTIYGDADLDGAVTPNDYALYNQGFSGAKPALWQYGDFDYSGVVDASDLALLDAGFAGQSGIQPCVPEFCPPVPEPGVLGLSFLGGLGMLARRRKR